MDILLKFGERIRYLRQKLNISQEKLAELTGLHRTYIGGIERGERNPSLENIYKLSRAFELTLSELFGGIK